MLTPSWRSLSLRISALALLLFIGCSDDGEGDESEADQLGVGAQCSDDDDCGEEEQACLMQFKGGYCGIEDCIDDLGCPDGSRCVAHEDGVNYCFRVCQDKSECNLNRDPDNESNCSANITFVENDGGKACVPPSG